jgi:hypothetical protein
MIRAAEKSCAAVASSQFAVRGGVLRPMAPTATNSDSNPLPRAFDAFEQVRSEGFPAPINAAYEKKFGR